MCNKNVLIILALSISVLCHAKTEYPEWVDSELREKLFPSSSYYTGFAFAEIKPDETPENVIERIKQRAYGDLTAKISVKVQRNTTDKSEEIITSNNAYSESTFSSVTTLSTRKIEIPGIEEKTFFDKSAKYAAVLVFVQKEGLATKLQRQLSNHLSRANIRLEDTENYMAENNKTKALSSLESARQSLQLADDTRHTMTAIDSRLSTEDLMEEDWRNAEQKAISLERELNKNVKVFLLCNFDGGNDSHKSVLPALSGELSRKGCLITESPEEASWSVEVSISTTPYNIVKTGDYDFFYSYATAILKITDSHGKPFMSDQIRTKGGHTLGYEQASEDAIRQLLSELSKHIIKSIQK